MATLPVITWEKFSVFDFKRIPWDTVSQFDPAVIRIHVETQRLVEIKEGML
ncbi:MAG: hypothetical protein ACLR6I_16440 [Waltera sp.]